MLSIVIPTYGREMVLLDSIGSLLRLLSPGAEELLVMDQTSVHEIGTQNQLEEWNLNTKIRWNRLPQPSIVNAMNMGLQQATGDLVLFLDDDIIPSPALVTEHVKAHALHPEAWAVAGQILQPGEEPAQVKNPTPSLKHRLTESLKHRFNSTQPGYTLNVMAGNLSVKRAKALEIGGFDPNYIGVAYRFESDFARRIWAAGGNVWYEPKASIRHLRAPSGGTRAYGHHLTSASPMHGVGDYYFALRHGQGLEKWWYIARRPLREVRTKFHLQHPWYIPIKLLGELRAMLLAFKLVQQHPKSPKIA